MFVLVDRDFSLNLRESRELKSFKLVSLHPATMQQRVQRALDRIHSRLDLEHAWISIAWIREQPEVAGDLAWQHQFTGVLGFAERKGWIDTENKLIRAHIEWNAMPAA
jgi:hypothetical protein